MYQLKKHYYLVFKIDEATHCYYYTYVNTFGVDDAEQAIGTKVSAWYRTFQIKKIRIGFVVFQKMRCSR